MSTPCVLHVVCGLASVTIWHTLQFCVAHQLSEGMASGGTVTVTMYVCKSESYYCIHWKCRQ